ncbi:THAP domain-containing protein 1-like isoform X8 [Periplaneta americana]|uniref:THAP domain-containing protein 1-like isoform X8 n=1 Tax=Periplaneta americana TaxID=6978 RepID=UPI0037E8D049
MMVRSCAAFNCSNAHGYKDKEGRTVTFHRFPLSNESLNQKWIAATRRENFFPTMNHSLCSVHFENSSYLRNYVNRRQLKPDAVPTIFDFSHRVKKIIKKKITPKPRNGVGIGGKKKEDYVDEMPDSRISTREHDYSLASNPSKVKRRYETILERNEETEVKKKLKSLGDTCGQKLKNVASFTKFENDSSNSVKRKWIYSEQMSYLNDHEPSTKVRELTICSRNDMEESISENVNENRISNADESIPTTTLSNITTDSQFSASDGHRKTPKKKSEDSFLTIQGEKLSIFKMDGDYNFLISFLPIMKQMNDIQKLNFRTKMRAFALEIMTGSQSVSSAVGISSN